MAAGRASVHHRDLTQSRAFDRFTWSWVIRLSGLEQVKDVAGAHAIFSMSEKAHLGLDQRAYVMVKIQNGAWKYQP